MSLDHVKLVMLFLDVILDLITIKNPLMFPTYLAIYAFIYILLMIGSKCTVVLVPLKQDSNQCICKSWGLQNFIQPWVEKFTNHYENNIPHKITHLSCHTALDV